MKTRALFIGRFQPFHNGHLYSINHVLEKIDELIIVVAAAQYSFTMDNPFTAGERIEMIRAGLGDLYEEVYIVPVDNIPSNYEWPRHVLSYTPRAQVVYSNNEIVRALFRNYGLEVRETPLIPGVSGTIVRRLMIEGGEWEKLVPAGTAMVIKEINGVERVRLLWKISPRMVGERY
ncbi:MAG: nicotinamide-nucleotide adenylyltransferase [Candidatus Nezhaarchaeales archaeon]|nr:MAG: nicotinate-nucleotide adenylyltransferase [Candidatus Nezhaarchaeota archaeon WYZ-LMO8]TDA37362.1 MAG: nicotinate-nucleotide adenylyltransferase [Candidatus Nezhaarchaeota archaeon WYZ-LMO7]